MVNKAVQEMVVGARGEAAWREIKRHAGVTEEGFISNEAYPDEITYRLVGAASVLTGAPAETILRAIAYRPGLMPFVEGLLSGLGKMFGTATIVTHLESRQAGASHDIFLVEW